MDLRPWDFWGGGVCVMGGVYAMIRAGAMGNLGAVRGANDHLLPPAQRIAIKIRAVERQERVKGIGGKRGIGGRQREQARTQIGRGLHKVKQGGKRTEGIGLWQAFEPPTCHSGARAKGGFDGRRIGGKIGMGGHLCAIVGLAFCHANGAQVLAVAACHPRFGAAQREGEGDLWVRGDLGRDVADRGHEGRGSIVAQEAMATGHMAAQVFCAYDHRARIIGERFEEMREFVVIEPHFDIFAPDRPCAGRFADRFEIFAGDDAVLG